jgi:endonuclease YncB( thermonuclease family)
MKPSAPPSEDAVLALRDHGGRTPVFTLKSTATWARVVSQHDADTLTAVFSVFGTYYKFPIRLFGIDACEMTARNSSNKALALRARDRLFQLVTGRRPSPGWKKQDFEAYFEERVCVVWLECCDFDKYGRLLAHVYPAENCERSFSDVLVDEKLAYAYQGGAKLLEEEQRRVLSPPSVEERSPLTHGSVHIEPVRIGRMSNGLVDPLANDGTTPPGPSS